MRGKNRDGGKNLPRKKKTGNGVSCLCGKMHKKKIQNHKWARKMSDP